MMMGNRHSFVATVVIKRDRELMNEAGERERERDRERQRERERQTDRDRQTERES